ncbi:hypothetical protein [Brevibacterium spongiae]|uniref:Uncharacterized protein n=1 Tax=Brevibacterium spongiae TaxID=2909672 RepID=A0ABY5SLM6_9MICO|nr:hypothetical protein [Brevibacterium spongiae]UVI35430.1 hypothetical protein L1F31_15095 [Brevibacterium spongiae]
MPEQPDEVVPAEDAAGGDGTSGSGAERSADDVEPVDAEAAADEAGDAKAPADDEAVDAEPVDAEAEAERAARVEAAKRRYRATLRNEADTGEGGFSKDYYRAQKPPHWS